MQHHSTKEKILDTVLEFIKDNQLNESLTLSNVAKKANIGKSTVYEHFSSKEQMIEETCLHLLKRYSEQLLSAIPMESFTQAFYAQLRLIHRVMKEARMIADALFFQGSVEQTMQSKTTIASMKAIRDAMNERFTTIFALGIKENLFELKVPQPYTDVVISSIISGVLMHHINGEIDLSDDALYGFILKNIINVL